MNRVISSLITLLLLPFISLSVYASENDIAAIINGKEISYQVIDKGCKDILELKKQLENIENELFVARLKHIERLIDNAALVAEAERKGVSKEKLFEIEVMSKVPKATDEDVRNAVEGSYEEFDDMTSAQIFFAKVSVMDDLYQQALVNYKQTIRKKFPYKILLNSTQKTEIIESESIATRHFKGNKKAKVKAVVFSDFDCGYCAELAQTFDELMKEYEGDIALSFRQYPVNGDSEMLATATECAADQGKFWALHDALWQIGEYQDEMLDPIATKIGINVVKWKDCRQKDPHSDWVSVDKAAGEQLGLEGTPTTFINGIKVVGSRDISYYRRLIDYTLNL